MRKYFLAFCLAFCLVLALAVPSSAYNWPPEKYEMPRTVLTTEEIGKSLSGLKDSIRSIGNTGLMILGICLSIFLIPLLFNRLVLDNLSSHRKNKRKTYSALDHSFDRIEAEDGLGASSNFKSRGLAWRESRSEPGLEEQIYQRESSYSPGEFSEGAQRVRPHRRRG